LGYYINYKFNDFSDISSNSSLTTPYLSLTNFLNGQSILNKMNEHEVASRFVPSDITIYFDEYYEDNPDDRSIDAIPDLSTDNHRHEFFEIIPLGPVSGLYSTLGGYTVRMQFTHDRLRRLHLDLMHVHDSLELNYVHIIQPIERLVTSDLTQASEGFTLMKKLASEKKHSGALRYTRPVKHRFPLSLLGHNSGYKVHEDKAHDDNRPLLEVPVFRYSRDFLSRPMISKTRHGAYASTLADHASWVDMHNDNYFVEDNSLERALIKTYQLFIDVEAELRRQKEEKLNP
jgi:hypothetical protein